MRTETDREAQNSLPRVAAPRADHVFVMLVGDKPTVGGARCSLQGVEEVLFVRGERGIVEQEAASARVTVALPDRKVSALHARLVRSPAGWRLHDAGSRNGTFVDGVRVSGQLLGDGDTFEIGRTVLRIRLALPTPDGTPPLSSGEEQAEPAFRTLLPALRAEHTVLWRMATSRASVLLLGDTGTGKEMAARAVHAISRPSADFVGVNCAAMPDALVEALLFGHVKGAFSGSTRDEIGFVRRAHGGTLFLDEIGDLPRAAQAVLLRVLQESEVVPVGSTNPIAVDLRVVAATHQPIGAMVDEGRFRRDLVARLQGFTHHLWPLARRREDIGLVVAQLLRSSSIGEAEGVRISSEAARALVRFDWPLNVRELSQALSHALALADGGEIGASHLPRTLTSMAKGSPHPRESSPTLSPEQRVLRDRLIADLRRCSGNVAEVSRGMKKAPMQVYRWMQRLGIDPRAFR